MTWGKNIREFWCVWGHSCNVTVICSCVCVQVADLDTLKQSSRLVHYCATPLLFDPVFRKQIQEELVVQPQIKVFLFCLIFSLYVLVCLLVPITLSKLPKNYCKSHNSEICALSRCVLSPIILICLILPSVCRRDIALATPPHPVEIAATAQILQTCCPVDWRRSRGYRRSPACFCSSMYSTSRAWASSWSRSDRSRPLAGLRTCLLLYFY